jgi:hypothetical protein
MSGPDGTLNGGRKIYTYFINWSVIFLLNLKYMIVATFYLSTDVTVGQKYRGADTLHRSLQSIHA